MADSNRPHMAVLVSELPTEESVVWNQAFQAIPELEGAIAGDRLFRVLELLNEGGYGELARVLAGDAQRAITSEASTSA
jgi:hypothetical protein